MSITHLVGLTVATVIWMGGKPVGYLAKVGPAPLRFKAPSRGPEEAVPLPPLVMTNTEPALEFYGPPPPPGGVIVTEVTAEPAAAVAPAPLDPNAMITPQMLIQFFNKDGTNGDYSVVAPFQFNPPPATTIPAPPSKATYTTK